MRSALSFNCLRILMASGLVSLALAAGSGRVIAGEDNGSGNMWDKMLETLNVKTTVGPPRDFVKETQPDPSTLKFLPVGTPHPKRAVRAKSANDIEAAKAALDAARDAQLAPPPARAAKSKRAVKPKPPKASEAAAGR